MTTRMKPSLAAVLAIAVAVVVSVGFEERFGEGWENLWVISDWKKDEIMAGDWNHTSGKSTGDPEVKGI
ncbi:hypothetical protein OPV22_000924 [Ensete ventricosum]|uniref:Calreticulin n=1 Tax=Ensete ventricosum TaxID=4639 RepID=A0AAV8RVC4_ENSVE|nr:hypothetical protein OPV22_000924 [Ensete ventricosum]